MSEKRGKCRILKLHPYATEPRSLEYWCDTRANPILVDCSFSKVALITLISTCVFPSCVWIATFDIWIIWNFSTRSNTHFVGFSICIATYPSYQLGDLLVCASSLGCWFFFALPLSHTCVCSHWLLSIRLDLSQGKKVRRSKGLTSIALHTPLGLFQYV